MSGKEKNETKMKKTATVNFFSVQVFMTDRATQAIQYRKIPKISDTRKFAVITLKIEQDVFCLE